MYINTHCNYSQPTLIKLDNENIGGHLTPLQSFFCCLTVFDDWYTVGTLVHCYSLSRPETTGTPIVIFAVLTVFWLFLTIGTVKTAKMTIGVPIVTCLHIVRRIHKALSCTQPVASKQSTSQSWDYEIWAVMQHLVWMNGNRSSSISGVVLNGRFLMRLLTNGEEDIHAKRVT